MKSLTTYLILFCSFLATRCGDPELKHVGKKIKIQLHGEVKENDWIRIDNLLIKHTLPDTTIKLDPLNFKPTNIITRSDEGDFFSISPSRTKIPISKDGKWGNFRLPTGMIVSLWIDCLAINQKIAGKNVYMLDMPNYFSYEGILIIERKDGKDLQLSFNKSLPLSVEILTN